MSNVPFHVGQRIKRKRIHDQFGGNPQCGISVSAQVPCVFVFTGDSGEKHGYKDEFVSATEFVYSGQGRTGNQTFDTSTTNGRANAGLRDHSEDGNEVHLFEESSIDDTFVVYLGEYEYVDHHFEERTGADGKLRDEIRFRLRKLSDASNSEKETVSGESIRGAAEDAADESPAQTTSGGPSYATSQAVRNYALEWADGVCQGCGDEAPFVTVSGDEYLEVHHVFRLGDGGPDHPDAVIALCPNCHREVYHGRRGGQFNQELAETLRERAQRELGHVPDVLAEDPEWS
jgi:5-methylcytosine-specific restriction protein A